MADIRAFTTVANFTLNDSNATNPVGELSPRSLSYSLDPKSYGTDHTDLVVFHVENVSPTEDPNLESVLQAVSQAFEDIESQFGSGTLADNVNNLLGPGFTVSNIGTATINPIDGNNYPESISFTYTGIAGIWNFTVWLVDSVFQTQYDRFTVTPIPPIDAANLDNIIADYLATSSIITGLTDIQLINRLNATLQSQNITPTEIRRSEFQITSPTVAETSYTSVWYSVINGNPTLVSETEIAAAINTLLVTDSTYDAETWANYFAAFEAFNRWYIVPRWDNIALDNGGLTSPYLSPTVDPTLWDEDIVGTYFPDETDTVAAAGLVRYSVATYKSAGFFVLADQNNPVSRAAFNVTYPDYQLTDINTPAIGIVTEETRQFILKLDETLRVADAYTTGSTLSVDYEIVSNSAGSWVQRRGQGLELWIYLRVQP